MAPPNGCASKSKANLSGPNAVTSDGPIVAENAIRYGESAWSESEESECIRDAAAFGATTAALGEVETEAEKAGIPRRGAGAPDGLVARENTIDHG